MYPLSKLTSLNKILDYKSNFINYYFSILLLYLLYEKFLIF
ncbi:hypothetical protein STFR1_30504 [Bacillus vallismortis]